MNSNKTRTLTMSSEDGQPLHMLFFPTTDPGHMQPMLGMAELFAGRGVTVSIITTPANVQYVQPSVDRAKNIQLHTIPFPSKEVGLPEGCENLAHVPKHLIYNYFTAFPMLQKSYDEIVRELLPDCVVSDVFFYWTHAVTAELGIPRLVFDSTSFFSFCVSTCVDRHRPQDSVKESAESVVVIPGLCHRIEMHRSQLPNPKDGEGMLKLIIEANSKCYGRVANNFHELEPDYLKQFTEEVGRKVWALGPVAPRNRDNADDKSHDCMKWLDSKSPASVLYVCFGSTGSFTKEHIQELAFGLEASSHPFVWVTGKDGNEWIPQGFEERVGGKGSLIIRGWSPQLLILNHPSIGGFVTHCGWNSCLEGLTAGLPLATWPMNIVEQFYNERLIVDVLRIGVSVGVKKLAFMPENRDVMEAEMVKKAVDELMGSGEAADLRRQRAKELGGKARKAVEKGGSSYANMTNLIQELIDRKNGN